MATETVILGGIVGAVLGALFGDPFRDQKGRYTTRTNGLGTWIMQAIAGAFLGAIFTPMLLDLLATLPLVAGAIFASVVYFVYRTEVDPR